jgi:hypothetical protein
MNDRKYEQRNAARRKRYAQQKRLKEQQNCGKEAFSKLERDMTYKKNSRIAKVNRERYVLNSLNTFNINFRLSRFFFSVE